MAQKKFIIDGGFQTTDDSIIAANLEMTGHILPTVDSNGSTGFDLGSTTKKWRDLYLSEGSLYIDGQKVIESDSGTIVVQADANQSLTTQVSGSGVLTLQSGTTVNMNGTLQMAAGKKITDVGGNAVVFGDKVDMDSNKIVNVGTPTAATDGASKSYVDSTVSDLVNGAPGALDTLNELANALGDDSNFAATMTTSLGLKAATTYVDDADAAVTLAFQNADTNLTATINAAWLAADSAQTTSINAAWLAADTAQTTAITTAYQTYADQAEADAETAAAADATTKANQALVDAKAYADTAEVDARAYTDTRESAITTAYQTYADTAESDAITTASGDATTKANAALTSANAYTDTEVANLVDSAPGAIDTLNELAAALGDDANFSATMTTSLGLKAATTYVDSQDVAVTTAAATDATNKANAAQAAAATDATTKASAAETNAAADATTKANNAITTAASDATTKADAAEAAAIAHTNTREVAIVTGYETYADVAESDAITTAAGDATTKADAAQAAAESTAASDATLKANAAQSNAEATAASALATAVANIESNISMTRFHSSVTDVTSASTVAYTFSDLVGAEDYAVYVNRMIIRPGELSSVNLSTGVVTFNASIVEEGDEIEVAGWKFS
jgi:hypothetical protein